MRSRGTALVAVWALLYLGGNVPTDLGGEKKVRTTRGLSGAGKRLVAAYILPRRDDRRVDNTHTLYVSILDE